MSILSRLQRELRLKEVNFEMEAYPDGIAVLYITLVCERIEIMIDCEENLYISHFLGSEDILGGDELLQHLLHQYKH